MVGARLSKDQLERLTLGFPRTIPVDEVLAGRELSGLLTQLLDGCP